MTIPTTSAAPPRSTRSRLTYANAMATVAVFIALGGTSYAALRVTGKNVPKDALTGADIKNLTGKDVRNNTLTGADVNNLTSADVSNGGLLAEDFRPGQLPVGPEGPQGIQGPQGVAGPPGISGYELVQVVDDFTADETFERVSAVCPAGKKILGGGAAVQDSKIGITTSRPTSSSKWFVQVDQIPGQDVTSDSRVFVIITCANTD